MMIFLIELKICFVFLLSTVLSEEKIFTHQHSTNEVKSIYNNIYQKTTNYYKNKDLIGATFTQIDAAVCNETQACRNGGSCLQHACVCLPGTSGLFCEIVDDCKNEKICRKDRYTYCEYSVEQQKAQCHCNVMEYRFDDASKTCRSCLCTPTFSQQLNSFSYCEYKGGQQICTCTEGYAYKSNQMICESCNCGPNSTWCEFDKLGQSVCGCIEGFIDYFGRCRECVCGIHGRCKINGFYNGYCECDSGYEEHNKKCVECSCGKYGKCVFDSNGTQAGCACLPGYDAKTGTCEICNCGENSNCSFADNTKICNCQDGFEDINGFCTDINECEKYSPCKVSTRCVNTLGSYKCICDKGYTRNHETLLCEDIDECQVSITCSQPNTKCINTNGSFKCMCESDFITQGGSDSNTFCEKSSSNLIYTVSVTLFVVVSLIVSAVIYHQKNNLRRMNSGTF